MSVVLLPHALEADNLLSTRVIIEDMGYVGFLSLPSAGAHQRFRMSILVLGLILIRGVLFYCRRLVPLLLKK